MELENYFHGPNSHTETSPFKYLTKIQKNMNSAKHFGTKIIRIMSPCANLIKIWTEFANILLEFWLNVCMIARRKF